MARKRAKTRPKSRRARTPAKRTATRRPIPEGFHRVTPYLSVAGGIAAMEFYQKAFGARKLLLQLTPDGKVMHGRLKIGDSIVMLSDAFPASGLSAPTAIGATTVTIHLYSKNVDALWQRALGAGATVAMPLSDTFWGERYAQLTDPFGHRWSLSQRIALSPAEKKRLEAEAMAMFADRATADAAPPK